MHKILVTGGAGFIGSNFVHYWLNTVPDSRVHIIDALTYAGNMQNLASVKDSPRVNFVEGDICDQGLIEHLLAEERIDTIVHFAAESHVDRSITGPDEFLRTNITGTHSLLKAAKKVWLDDGLAKHDHRFHHVSTDEVYGTLGPNDPPFSETTAYAPNSPYSASKASSDHLVRAYHHTYGLQVTTSNCSNNYGPYHFPEKLIPLCIINALLGKELPIYGDGKNIRDWLYVDDHCRGIDLVLRDGKIGETYNIGGNNEWTNIDLVKKLCDTIDKAFESNTSLISRFPNCPAALNNATESLIKYVKDRPGHDMRYAIDATKSREELKYEPLETFESGIQKTVEWYLDNEDWWRAVMDGSYKDWLNKQYD